MNFERPWFASPIGIILMFFTIVALSMLTSFAHASDVIEFPEEELSRESVLPVFDQPEAVKKRYVPTETRIEVDGFFGLSLNDPFLNNYPIGIEGQYHLDEIHAVGLILGAVVNTNTSYVGQIQSLPAGNNIPFNQNPTPNFLALGEYEFTPYYGKISLGKQTNLNLNISATGRLGMIGITGGSSSVAGGLGINQRFFLTRNFGLKADLSALIYQKNDILISSGSTQLVTNLFLTFGVVWLFPQL